MCRSNEGPDEALIKGAAPPNSLPLKEPEFTFAELKVRANLLLFHVAKLAAISAGGAAGAAGAVAV